MATDARGHTVPGAGDAPARAALTDLSLSIRDVAYVADSTGRATLVSDLATAGKTVSASNPLYVHRADATTGRNLEVTVDGSTWNTIDARTAVLTTTGILTAATGWSITTQAGVIRGGVVFLRTEFTRTGADITVSSAGNIANVNIATIASGWRPSSSFNAGMSSTGTGVVASGDVNGGDTIRLTAVAPGANIATSDVLSLYGTWPLA